MEEDVEGKLKSFLDYVNFPKFNIQRNELLRFDRARKAKILGVGISAVVAYYAYTASGFDLKFEHFIMGIPFIGELMKITLFKVFIISMLLYVIKDVID